MKFLKWVFLALWTGLLAAACVSAPQPASPAEVIPATSPTPSHEIGPTAAMSPAPGDRFKLPPIAPTPSGETVLLPSPDGRWTAMLDRRAGSLEVADEQGVKHTLFPSGSNVHSVSWSPDSLRLAATLSNIPRPVQSPDEIGVAEIWLVRITDSGLSEPRLIRAPGASDADAGAWITFGAWSPDSRRVLFWPGPLSASIQADGLPLWSLEVESGEVTRLAEAALVNPSYQSWAPDGSALVFTNGGYRSAQVNKWLSLYEVGSGLVGTLIAKSALVPGAVAWSPRGSQIAFAAVEAGETGNEWADWMGWDNPAILARRIYLLDRQTGEYWRLNSAEAYQDAPRWSADGTRLYYVQMEGSGVALMAADPASGAAHALPGCLAPLPAAAGYYGQVDWGELYQNCPGVAQSFLPASPAAATADPQMAAIQKLRALFGLPDLPLELVKMATMINSPSGRLPVALYQDSDGRKYSVEPQSNQVVEIDARVVLASISPEAPALTQAELRAKAKAWMRAAIPDFDSLESELFYEEGAKGDYYFFNWRDDRRSSVLFNRPFAQIGLHQSGVLFAYYNTLNVP